MQYKNKRTVLIYMLIFLLVSFIGMLFSARPFFSNFSRIFYGCIIVVWMMTVLRRITDPALKRLLVMSGSLLLSLILFRALRYQFEQGSITVHRLMWYFYYFPICFIPVLSLKIAMRCGRFENIKQSPLWNLLYIPALVLTVLFLTNGKHQLAFRFIGDYEKGEYANGPVYYISMIWVSGLVVSSVIIILYRFMGRVLRKDSWAYYCVLGCSLYFLLTDYFDLAPVINGMQFLNPVDTLCIFVVCGWEACIQTCLLPSNSGYKYFFENSGLIARIVDEKGHIRIASKGSESDWSRLKEDYHFLGRPVWGGNLSYAEDISAISRATKELKEISERLLEENSIKEAENDLKKETVHVAVMNRLYDEIAEFSEDKTEEIEKLLTLAGDDKEFEANLKKACILASYIKRRGNLYILGEENTEYDFNDLYLSFKESLDYFSLNCPATMLSAENKEALEKGMVFSAYDCLQAVLEKLSGKVRTLIVGLDSGKELKVRLMFDLYEKQKEIADEILKLVNGFGADTEVSFEDATTVIAFVFRRKEKSAKPDESREGRWDYAVV